MLSNDDSAWAGRGSPAQGNGLENSKWLGGEVRTGRPRGNGPAGCDGFGVNWAACGRPERGTGIRQRSEVRVRSSSARCLSTSSTPPPTGSLLSAYQFTLTHSPDHFS